MALELSCNLYQVQLLDGVNDLGEYPTSQWRYYMQYTDCCSKVITTVRIDGGPNWDEAGDPVFQTPIISFSTPYIYVRSISDPTDIRIPTLIVITLTSQSFPTCVTTTTTSTPVVPTTTKPQVHIIFKSSCNDVATYSFLLHDGFGGRQRVVCFRDPLVQASLLTGTFSTILQSGSYSLFFGKAVANNVGPGCECDCSTQSLSCLSIKIRSSSLDAFSYVDCSSGLLTQQFLNPLTFLNTEEQNLISIPGTCSIGISTSTQSVNFTTSQGLLVQGFTGSNSNYTISYSGPYGSLMSSTNSEYHARETGDYWIRSNIVTTLDIQFSATGSVTSQLVKRNTYDVITILDQNSIDLYNTSTSAVQSLTASISLGSEYYSLNQDDRVYVRISKNSSVLSASYSSSVCISGQLLRVFATQSQNSNTWSLIRTPGSAPIFNVYGSKYQMTFNHPTGETNWSGKTYSVPSGGNYKLSWRISGTYTIPQAINVVDFNLSVSPFTLNYGNYIYSNILIPTQPATGTFSFFTENFSIYLYKGQVVDMGVMLSMNQINFPDTFGSSLGVSINFDNGSFFEISSEPKWDTLSRNFTYFEVLKSPTHSANANSYGLDLCVRPSLTGAPPVTRLLGSWTYSICQFPGSLVSTLSTCATGSICGSYTREFVEIAATACQYPSTISLSSLDVDITPTTTVLFLPSPEPEPWPQPTTTTTTSTTTSPLWFPLYGTQSGGTWIGHNQISFYCTYTQQVSNWDKRVIVAYANKPVSQLGVGDTVYNLSYSPFIHTRNKFYTFALGTTGSSPGQVKTIAFDIQQDGRISGISNCP